ncbi:MAG: hypothetical protein WKF43_10565 [Acidimicrobiales bacterium]
MARLRPLPVAALAAWTLFTWVSRVGLAWGDDDLSTAAKVVATFPILIFVALALTVGVTLLTRGRLRPPTLALAGWTIGYWALRLPWILAQDHPGAFKVVHTALAAVAVGLAALTLRALGDRRLPSPAPGGRSRTGSRRARA